MIQLAKTTFGRKKDTSGAVGRAPPRPNPRLGQSCEVPGKSLLGSTSGSKRLVESRLGCNGLQLCGYRDFAIDVGWCLALRGPVRQCALAHSVHSWNVTGKYGPHGFFFLIKKGAGGCLKRSAVQALLSLQKRSRRAPCLVYTFCRQEVKVGLVVVNLLI